ncbi:MAG: hypothetical protein CMP47_08105 [Rickettsiales bacterium]|nr:hypothetical protein [Rickettsiales bacterium]
MKIAYHADDALDAQLISDLLNNGGIFAQVRGAGMQGAVGEAAAMGNVKVWVKDEDLAEAKVIIENWGNASFVDEEDAELFKDDEDALNSPKEAAEWSRYTILKASFLLICILFIFAVLIDV